MDEASKMNKLVKNLLTLNQLESGKDAAVMERFDIVSLIRGVLQTMDIYDRTEKAKVIFERNRSRYMYGQMSLRQRKLSLIMSAMRWTIWTVTDSRDQSLFDGTAVCESNVLLTGTPIPWGGYPESLE